MAADGLDRRSLRLPLTFVKQGITRATFALVDAEGELHGRGDDNPLPGLIRESGIGLADLQRILVSPSDQGRRDLAESVVRGHLEAVDRLLLAVSGARTDGAGLAFGALADGIEQAAATEFGDQGRIAAAVAAWAYSSFDEFDLVAFPLQYGSDAGEGDQVEVIRVGPGDATALMPPRPAVGGEGAKHGDGAGKVTGARVNHFGAFLDRLWRENDIMWGRLDAAEILIETMIPAHPGEEQQRAALVERLRNRAFSAILNEELAREDIARLFPAADEAAQAGAPVPDRLQRLIDAARSHPDDVVGAFRDAYRRPNQLPNEERLSDMGRAAHVAGGVMGGIAHLRGDAKPPLPFALAARLGRVAAGIVGAAVPSGRVHRRAELWFLALYVLGAQAGLPLAEHAGLAAAVLEGDGTLHETEALRQLLARGKP